VLAHLSQRCNSPDAARATVEPMLRRSGFQGDLYVASQDVPLAPIRITFSPSSMPDLWSV